MGGNRRIGVLGLQLEQFVQLAAQKLAVDRVVAKVGAGLVIQVGDDQFRQLGVIGTRELSQVVATMIRR